MSIFVTKIVFVSVMVSFPGRIDVENFLEYKYPSACKKRLYCHEASSLRFKYIFCSYYSNKPPETTWNHSKTTWNHLQLMQNHPHPV